MGHLNIPDNIGLIVSSYLVSLIFLPLFLFLSIFFYVFKLVLRIYLTLRHGRKFVGLVQGGDCLWTLGLAHESAIDVAVIFTLKSEEKKDLAEELKKRITTRILSNKQKYPKLNSTIHGFFGYGYMLRSTSTVDDLVSTVEITEDNSNYSKSIEEIFSECGRQHFPVNNTSMWQMITINAPASWKTKQNLKHNQYPILIRIHHVIGDGLSLTTNLVNIFSDEPVDFTKNLSQSMKHSLPKEPSAIEKILQFLHVIMLTPGYVFLRKFIRDAPQDVKIFKPAPAVSGERDFYFVHDEKVLETIKRIKKNVGDTAFIEIIFTVLSKSFENYFVNAKLDIPDVAIQVLPFISSIPKNSEQTQLTNSYSVLRFPIPILVKSDSLLTRLKEVKKYRRSTRNIIDFQVRHFCWNYLCGLWSAYFVLPLEKLENLAMCFSNLPGCPKLNGVVGFDIEHIYFVPPQYTTLGLFGTFFTYDNELHVSIGIDKKFFTNREQSRKIINDIFENITLFDEETNTNKKLMEINKVF